MTSTKQWAAAHGVCVEDTVPAVDDYNEPHERTADEAAMRTIILHGVAAVGYEVDRQPVIDWLKDQDLWDQVSPWERAFLGDQHPSDKQRSDARIASRGPVGAALDRAARRQKAGPKRGAQYKLEAQASGSADWVEGRSGSTCWRGVLVLRCRDVLEAEGI